MRTIRNPVSDDLSCLCRIWHDGWHEAHAAHVPNDLVEARNMTDFDRRLRAMLEETRVIGPISAPIGFCTLRADELMHLFVSPEVRGTGAALALLENGEARLKQRGIKMAWLACVIGNERAAHFYEREGWKRKGLIEYSAETARGAITLQEWRYESNFDLFQCSFKRGERNV